MSAINSFEQRAGPAALVRQALNRSGEARLKSVEVRPLPDGVRLIGRVPSYYLKQVAQAVAMSTEGICHVDNQMEVQGHS